MKGEEISLWEVSIRGQFVLGTIKNLCDFWHIDGHL